MSSATSSSRSGSSATSAVSSAAASSARPSAFERRGARAAEPVADSVQSPGLDGRGVVGELEIGERRAAPQRERLVADGQAPPDGGRRGCLLGERGEPVGVDRAGRPRARSRPGPRTSVSGSGPSRARSFASRTCSERVTPHRAIRGPRRLDQRLGRDGARARRAAGRAARAPSRRAVRARPPGPARGWRAARPHRNRARRRDSGAGRTPEVKLARGDETCRNAGRRPPIRWSGDGAQPVIELGPRSTTARRTPAPAVDGVRRAVAGVDAVVAGPAGEGLGVGAAGDPSSPSWPESCSVRWLPVRSSAKFEPITDSTSWRMRSSSPGRPSLAVQVDRHVDAGVAKSSSRCPGRCRRRR